METELLDSIGCSLSEVIAAVPKGTIVIIKGEDEADEMEITYDDFRKAMETTKGTGGGGIPTAMLDSGYNSSTATYDGLPKTGAYNGGYGL